MNFLNKTFKNRLTGDQFTIIDVYQNIAITSNKEKINTSLLLNDKLFIPVNNNLTTESVSVKKVAEDIIDPNRFFNDQSTYNTFAEKIKQIPLDKLPEDNVSNLPVSTDESAIIITDTDDEIEELKRKYGATSVDDSLRKQNEAFSKILNEEENLEQVEVKRDELNVNGQQQMEVNREYIEPPVQRFEAQREDPILTMFKNVKRNLEFSIDFEINGKIPRLDFIEMMEDSYEISIIEYLADEFTQNLLNDPNLIKQRIISIIKQMIDNKNSTTNSEKKVETTSTLKPQTQEESETPKRERAKRAPRNAKRKEQITSEKQESTT
jgi:hypothetical protein